MDEVREATEPFRQLNSSLVRSFEIAKTIFLPAPQPNTVGGSYELVSWNEKVFGNIDAQQTRFIAGLQMYAAGELVEAINCLVSGDRAVVISDRVLLRSLMESCGKTMWLLQHDISARTRMIRTLILRLTSLQQMRQFDEPASQTRTSEQKDELLQRCRDDGLTAKKSKWGNKFIINDHELPSQTALIKLSWGSANNEDTDIGRTLHRMTSLAVHGDYLSVYMHHGEVIKNDSHSQDQASMPIMMRAVDTIQLLICAGWCFMQAVDAYRKYMGWETGNWNEIRQEFLLNGQSWLHHYRKDLQQ